MVACCADRLPWKATRRTLILGLIMGSSLKMLGWGRQQLELRANVLSENVATSDTEASRRGNDSEAEKNGGDDR
jgi:hypothetical protein